MNINKSAGLFFIILGILFMIFPLFSAEIVSIIVGLSLLFFGISTAFMGWSMRGPYDNNTFANINIIIGIIAVILGFLFIFYIDALSFLVSIQFYIIGFIMILFGISGLLSESPISTFTSIIVLILGIIAIALAVFAMAQPIYIAIIIGIVLIIEGVTFLLD